MKKNTPDYKTMIQNRLEELLREQAGNKDSLLVVVTPDDLDSVTKANETWLATTNLNRTSTQLRQVREAIKRLQENTFGECVQCGEQIPPKRLAAVPWTPYCIECQELHDDHGQFETVSLERAGIVH